MYLNDAQSSLITILWIFDRCGHYSVIRINWSKTDQTYLQWVQQFKYLGIYIPLDPRYFLELNVTLIISQFNSKCEAWSSLPLLVVGRENLFSKMIFLPTFTYVFSQSLVWIPQQIFWRLDTVLSASILVGHPLGRALKTLQLPTDRAGLALLIMHIYYLFIIITIN